MMHPEGLSPPFTFIARMGLIAQTLAQLFDSLVRVSRRVACNHYASILAEARSSVPAGGMAPGAITEAEATHVPRAFIPPPKLMLA
jgi:hypothetical protein